MNVISVSTKAETLLCDDRIVLLQYQNKLLSNQAKEIMPAVLPINRTNLPLDGPHKNCYTVYTFKYKRPTNNSHQVEEASERKLMSKADKRSARRRARVEETEEKWGGRTSTDPKQKTQPDGDEELCQYGLCGDTCMPLRWKDTKKARSLKQHGSRRTEWC